MTIRRWERLTGREAVLAATGATYAETCVQRAANCAWDADMGLVAAGEGK